MEERASTQCATAQCGECCTQGGHRSREHTGRTLWQILCLPASTFLLPISTLELPPFVMTALGVYSLRGAVTQGPSSLLSRGQSRGPNQLYFSQASAAWRGDMGQWMEPTCSGDSISPGCLGCFRGPFPTADSPASCLHSETS